MKTVPAGQDEVHVIPVEGKLQHLHRREPCEKCPWRKDATGIFDAEAFKVSANTSYPGSRNVFACHSSGTEKPTMCAGFLLHGAHQNAAVHSLIQSGEIFETVLALNDGGHDLYTSYRAMAEANGVDPDDRVLLPLRKE